MPLTVRLESHRHVQILENSGKFRKRKKSRKEK